MICSIKTEIANGRGSTLVTLRFQVVHPFEAGSAVSAWYAGSVLWLQYGADTRNRRPVIAGRGITV